MIKVVVAEDEFFTRQGICRLLSGEPDIQVLGDADNGEKAIALVLELKPDVLLLDLRMPPGIDGLEVIRRLKQDEVPVKMIALTQEKRAVRAVEAEGAHGYVPKDQHQMLLTTLRCVAATDAKVFIKPEMSAALSELEERVVRAKLSPLEMEVWRLIAYKNEAIAARLHKTVGHIRNLVTELYFKLDIQDDGERTPKVQAIEMARLYGVLEEPEN